MFQRLLVKRGAVKRANGKIQYKAFAVSAHVSIVYSCLSSALFNFHLSLLSDESKYRDCLVLRHKSGALCYGEAAARRSECQDVQQTTFWTRPALQLDRDDGKYRVL